MAVDAVREDDCCLFMRGIVWLWCCQWTKVGA